MDSDERGCDPSARGGPPFSEREFRRTHVIHAVSGHLTSMRDCCGDTIRTEAAGPAPDAWTRGLAFAGRRGSVITGLLLCHVPLLAWYARRLTDGGDERWGLLALGVAGMTTPWSVWRAPVTTPAAWTVFLVLSGVVGWTSALPPLVRAFLLVVALGVVLGGGPGGWARAILLVLSLPVMNSLQFYVGYPLRVVAAELGRLVVACGGVATERRGVCLTWSGGDVVVDAPCSGLNMLWTAMLLAAGLAAWRRLSSRHTLLLVGVAGLAVVLANAVRVGLLFFVETGLWHVPAWFHSGLALVLFLGLTFSLVALAGRWSGGGQRQAERSGLGIGTRRSAVLALWAAMAVAGAAPLLTPWLRAEPLGAPTASATVFPGWPELYEGRPWVRITRNDRLSSVLARSTLTTGVFRQEGRWVVLRWIQQVSREVHPAADCFRARGYEVERSRLVRDARGATWSEFGVEREGQRWRVRERLLAENGSAWTDVSAWYWASVGRSSAGPWWAVTVIEAEPGE